MRGAEASCQDLQVARPLDQCPQEELALYLQREHVLGLRAEGLLEQAVQVLL